MIVRKSANGVGEVARCSDAANSQVRLNMPPESDSPGGGSGGPCPASQGVGDPKGLTQSARLRDDDPKRSGGRGDHVGRLPIRGQPCAALLARHMSPIYSMFSKGG